MVCIFFASIYSKESYLLNQEENEENEEDEKPFDINVIKQMSAQNKRSMLRSVNTNTDHSVYSHSSFSSSTSSHKSNKNNSNNDKAFNIDNTESLAPAAVLAREKEFNKQLSEETYQRHASDSRNKLAQTRAQSS